MKLHTVHTHLSAPPNLLIQKTFISFHLISTEEEEEEEEEEEDRHQISRDSQLECETDKLDFNKLLEN